MNKTVVTSVGILAVAAIICFVIYMNGNRYITVGAGQGMVYIIDPRTGDYVLIAGEKEIAAQSSIFRKKGIEAKEAMRLAKEASTLRKSSRNYSIIHEIMQTHWSIFAETYIIGWNSKKVEEKVYLVTYSFESSNSVICDPWERLSDYPIQVSLNKLKSEGYVDSMSKSLNDTSLWVWAFEVNMIESIVRNVNGDSVLVKKYGFSD